MRSNLIPRFAVVFMMCFWICISALHAQTMPWQKIQSTTATNIVFIKQSSIGLFMTEQSYGTTSLSTDGGNTWKILPSVRFVAAIAETFKSIFFLDGWTFKSVNKDSLFLSPPQSIPIQDLSFPNLQYNYRGLVLNAENNILFLGIDLRFFRSLDGGQTLNQIKFEPFVYYINNVVVDNNQVWASTEKGLFYSLDNGETFSLKGFTGINVGLFTASNNKLFAQSYSSNSAGVQNGYLYYRSLDTGSTWQIFSSPDSSQIYRLITYDQVIIIVTAKGLYRSSDNGITWQNISYNLPVGRITALAIDTKTKTLFAAVYGHGLYRTDLTTVSTREQPEAAYFLSSPAPNPSTDYTELTFALPRAASVSVTLYSTLGTEVWRSQSDILPAGEQRVLIDTRSLPTGVYVYRLTVGGVSSVGRVVVVK